MVYAKEKSILVDCGLFQGAEASKNGAHANGLEIDFDISRVQALFITHAHIDHVGRVPYLLAAGFDAPIYCSIPTAKLLPVVLEDALKIGFTRNERLIKQFLGKIKELMVPVEYKRWYSVNSDLYSEETNNQQRSTENQLRAKLKPAGHILGSAYIEFSLPTNLTNETDLLSTDLADVHRFNRSVGGAYAPGETDSHTLTGRLNYTDKCGSALEDISKPEEQSTTSAATVATNRLPNTENRSRGKDYRVIFSGDLGAPYSPLLPAPESPYRCDTLVLESTYGDKCHGARRNRSAKLKEVIEKALEDNGAVLIPAFSIGRTQELLYEIEEIIRRADLSRRCREHREEQVIPKTEYRKSNTVWDNLEVIIDSPMAAEFTEIYKDLKDHWDAEAQRKIRSGRHPLSFESLWTVENHDEHMSTVDYIRRRGTPCIVIAASGMCSGGRIMNYLKALLEDKRTDVLFVGYQAYGTPGRAIQKYGPRNGYVDIDGERYDINAGVHTVSGYSAHADQDNLINFVKRMRHKPREIRLVHGDSKAKDELGHRLTEEFNGIEIKY